MQRRKHAVVIRKRRHTKAHRLPEGAVPAARNRPRGAKGVMFNRGRTAVSCRRRPVFPREPARQLVPATACVSEESSIEPRADRSTFRRTPPNWDWRALNCLAPEPHSICRAVADRTFVTSLVRIVPRLPCHRHVSFPRNLGRLPRSPTGFGQDDPAGDRHIEALHRAAPRNPHL